ncbi:MAG: hypothetical protein OXE53_18790 [Deltaproteobacteria bacterium]|nr:hypothetical protein [Deltaproteobacteria bacterium]
MGDWIDRNGDFQRINCDLAVVELELALRLIQREPLRCIPETTRR